VPAEGRCEPPDGTRPPLGRDAPAFNVKTLGGEKVTRDGLAGKAVIVADPATAVFGVMLVRTGSGFGGGLITNAMGLERPLRPEPVAGLNVMMVETPEFATKAAGTFAVMILPSIFPALSVGSVESRVFPFHCTTVPFTKGPPFTVSTKSGPPALMTEGETEKITAPVLF
jgi:hypothetical protein